MLPTIKPFMAAHRLRDVVIVSDAGMISEKNMKDIEAAGLSFILGMRIPEVPYVVNEWRKAHPDTEIADGQVFVQPCPGRVKGHLTNVADPTPEHETPVTGTTGPCATSPRSVPPHLGYTQ